MKHKWNSMVELCLNPEHGTSINILGNEFVAADNARNDNEFQLGDTKRETAKNLRDAINNRGIGVSATHRLNRIYLYLPEGKAI